MSRSLRPLLALLAVLVPLGLVACGGDRGETEASSSTDVNRLLEDTFGSKAKVESGRIDLGVAIDAQGQAAQELGGPIRFKLGGPFESRERGLPKFKLDLSAEAGGQVIDAGGTSTGEKGYVRFLGTEYVLSDLMYRQLEAGYEESQKDSRSRQSEQPTWERLGIDPRRWLTSPVNAGDAKVGDEDTIKITGGVDVPRMLDDIDTMLGKASQLGLQHSGPPARLPSQLTEREKREVADAVKDVKVEIYTGKQDRILRRMVIGAGVQDPKDPASGSAAVKLDLSLTDLGSDQQIEAPANARPFEELAAKLRSQGMGGGLGGAGGGAKGGPSDRKLRRYVKCVEDAGSDSAKAQKCADILR
jgi:hypothetical protein